MSLKEVLVIGSLHYDIFLESQQLPRIGETISGQKWYPKLGGKGGNQALAASLYPVPTKILSAIGKDDFANYILNNLQETNVDTSYIQQLDNHNSGMSVAISNNEGDYGAIIVSGSNLHIDQNVLLNNDLWKNIGILMIQNEVDEQLNLLAAKKAKEKGIKVFYNAAPAKKIHSDFYQYVDILLVNMIEAEDITGMKITKLEEILKSSQSLSNSFSNVIISAGEQGVVLCEKDKQPVHFKGIKVKVKSTHGAGDTFAGTFCASWISGNNVNESIIIANKKAAEFISN